MQHLSLRLVSCSAVLLTAFSTSLLAKEFKHQHIEPAPLVNPWNAPDEEYLEPSITEKLKPGMSAAAEIIIERLEDIVSIPFEAIFEKEGRKCCY